MLPHSNLSTRPWGKQPMGASKPGGGRNGTKGTKGTEGTGTDCCNSASWQIFIWSNCIWDSGSSAGEWTLLFGCDFLGFLGSLGALAGRFGASIASKGMGWISSLLWAKVHASPLLHMPLALNWKHSWVATKLGAWRISSEECAKLHASPIVQRLDFQYLHILVNFKVFRVSWVVIWEMDDHKSTNPQSFGRCLEPNSLPKTQMSTDDNWCWLMKSDISNALTLPHGFHVKDSKTPTHAMILDIGWSSCHTFQASKSPNACCHFDSQSSPWPKPEIASSHSQKACDNMLLQCIKNCELDSTCTLQCWPVNGFGSSSFTPTKNRQEPLDLSFPTPSCTCPYWCPGTAV